MKYLPIFADLAGQHALLVGGNEDSARKLRLLLKTEARIRVVSSAPNAEVSRLAAEGRIDLRRRPFETADLADVRIAILGDAEALDIEEVAREIRATGVPTNVVDRPDLSTFIIPGIVDRDPIVVAIGSEGAAPVMVRRIRERIEALLPVRLGALARFAQSFRGAVSAAIGDGGVRRLFWERFFDGPVARDVLAGREGGTREAMLRLVNTAGARAERRGSVALVGAGPGDPDLLTLRALRLMQDADVIVHDALIGPTMLDYVRRDSIRVDVGKRAGRASWSQDEINAVLAEHAEAGRRVVRLKGGDPFIFGRGGEELAYLKARGISVDIVPGVTAALGAASAAGLPLTHRDHANRLTILTGHDRNGYSDFDANVLADPKGTLVIYMGLGAAPRIMAAALDAGRAAETPVAVIEKATLPEQRVLKASLGNLANLVEEQRVEAPALIVIGDVAALAEGETFETVGGERRRLAV
ncbi:siroheme synthase CysG [Nisaea acidiphila]|uniref:Siroheme synthase CysG n=1 Tax=Nisaea acidiphila TaxID=1862145 RepID=A0A9J7ASR4_9PROT|nr:siroheme synthase CysG [Nisaea acidiphila]UUX49906.1 siroheme synthase CysG [Nisaea acidiphila]